MGMPDRLRQADNPALFVRASVDFLDHRDASDAFPADNLNPGVLELDVVTEIGVGRLPEPFVQLNFGVFRKNDAKTAFEAFLSSGP